jgi:hypothetical protein
MNKVIIWGMAAMAIAVAPVSAQTASGPAAHQAAAGSPADNTAQPSADNEAEAGVHSEARDGTASGILKITTDPPEAAVKIDGEDYGLTPVEAAGLPPGEHVLELSKSGHFRRKATIQLDSAGAQLHFELSRPATLTVTSEPNGASISLDGKDAGTTPIRNDKLRPGDYKISATMEGYSPSETTIKIESGGADTLHIVLERITAEPPEPTVKIETSPPEKSSGKWKSGTILIAFFVFIAVLIGVEKSSY